MEIVFDAPNNRIQTVYNGGIEGFNFNFFNKTFDFGTNFGSDGSILIDATNNETFVYARRVVLGSSNNGIFLKIDDFNSLITTEYGGADIGLKLDFTTNQFYLGSTTEYIGIDTTNNTLIAGANLTSASAGGNSGVHLKININGTNYKIE